MFCQTASRVPLRQGHGESLAVAPPQRFIVTAACRAERPLKEGYYVSREHVTYIAE